MDKNYAIEKNDIHIAVNHPNSVIYPNFLIFFRSDIAFLIIFE